MANPKTILLKGSGIRKEALAAAATAITPGYLVERDSTGKFIEHATAAANAAPLFAVENDLIGGSITDDYAVGDQVQAEYMQPGSEVYALVAASAAAIVIGDDLESAGDGTVRIATADAATDTAQRRSMIAQAIEAVDNSGGGSEARIRIEVY